MINKKLLLLIFGLIMTTQMIFSQVPSYVPSNGLVGYWPFNGNANDQTPNGNNGTVNGASLTTDRFGNTNSAYDFDGISNYITILDNNVFNMQNFTISTWVKNSSTAPTVLARYILNKGCNTPSPSFRLYYQNDGIQQEYVSDCWVPNRVYQNGPSSNNLWTNIIYSYDGQNLKMYVDGVLFGTANQSGSLTNNNNPIYIGCTNATNNCPQLSSFYAGKIDDIGMWNRALSEQEITNMYNGVNYSDTCNAVSGSLVNGLVGYWPFCGNANDQSGNGLNGTVNGATLTTDRFGNSNSSYLFNNNSRIKINYNNSLNTTTGTISAWIYVNSLPTSNDPQDIIFGKGWGFPQLIIRNDGKIYLETMNSQSTATFIQSTSTISQGNWYHILGFYSSNSFKLYINGVLDKSIIPSPTPSFYSYCNSEYWIGGFNHLNSCIPDDNVQNFNGLIDDIGFWNRELTQQEITNLYNAANTNECLTMTINTGVLNTNPVNYISTVTIYPNPANDHITIDCGNLTNVSGWSIKITNTLGQEVFNQAMNTQQYVVPLNTWTGQGMYFVKIIDAQNEVVNIKKIILQ